MAAIVYIKCNMNVDATAFNEALRNVYITITRINKDWERERFGALQIIPALCALTFGPPEEYKPCPDEAKRPDAVLTPLPSLMVMRIPHRTPRWMFRGKCTYA